MIVARRVSIFAAALLLFSAGSAQAQTTLEWVGLYGGPGNQDGRGIWVGPDGIYLAGYDHQAAQGLAVKYGLPPSGPLWSRMLGHWNPARGVAVSGSTVYLAGSAYPRACGANDGVGGTEGKPGLFRYTTAGSSMGCGSANYFHYRGGEGYTPILPVHGGSSLYVAGAGEEMGWGGSRTILARYAPDGSLLWKRRFATDPGGNHLGGTYSRIGSWAHDMAWLGGHLYVAGQDREAGQVGGPPGQGMLLKVDADAEPADPPGVYATNLYPLWERVAGVSSNFYGVTTLGGHVFAAGHTYQAGNCHANDLLVEKYGPAGNRVWRSNPAAAGGAALYDIVAIGNRLLGVGYLDAACNGDADLLVVEIDPADGAILWQVLWGGSRWDRAWAADTDGSDLFVVGESRSFTAGGNGTGQNDLVLLHFSFGPTIVEIDIKPGSDPNAVNPRVRGKIPVAILTTSTADGDPLDFDAWDVDPSTLDFGPDGAGICHAQGHAEDVDGDGDLDMVVHFKTRRTGIACGHTEATLTGETFGGEAIEGTDSITTAGCGSPMVRMLARGTAPSDAVADRAKRKALRRELRKEARLENRSEGLIE